MITYAIFITIVILCFYLAHIAYKNNPLALTNRLFAFTVTLFVVWAIFNFLENEPRFGRLTVLLIRLDFFVAASCAYFWFLFCAHFFRKNVIKPLLYPMVLAIFFSTISLTDWVIANIRFEDGRITFDPGKLYGLYGLYIIICVLAGSILLIVKYKRSKGVERTQILYVIIGFALTLIFEVVMSLFLQRSLPLEMYRVAIFGILFFIVLTSYAIVRHRFMGIKFILRKYSVYAASLASIILPALIIKFLVYRYFAQTALRIDFLILIIAISVFPLIKNYYYRLANKHFFSSLYDARQVIANLSDKLSSTLEVEKIYKYISDVLIKSFRAKAVEILVYHEERKYYLIKYNNGFRHGGQKIFFLNKKLRSLFAKMGKLLIIEEIKTHNSSEHKNVIDLLSDFGAEIVIPLNLKNKAVGVIIMGAKESGDTYNREDLEVLEIIGAQAAIALENALLYEETRRFGKKLEKEVIKATTNLRSANKKLRQLDTAKSEFISIASHQLRTPLSIIKGYISMILEGVYGEVTKEKREILEKIYLSNERLTRLVENLLNVSRIEAGKINFLFQKVQINDIVVSVIDELSNLAAEKELKLKYQKPDKPLPQIKADKEKIRQVITNLIDNAIKYTEKGEITVGLKRVDNRIRFCVSDTGMGIRREDSINLFKKFSRGEKTPLVHTEGVGLGLYVASTVIKAHRGRIWAESEGENKGAVFCFTLPINPAPLPKKR